MYKNIEIIRNLWFDSSSYNVAKSLWRSWQMGCKARHLQNRITRLLLQDTIEVQVWYCWHKLYILQSVFVLFAAAWYQNVVTVHNIIMVITYHCQHYHLYPLEQFSICARSLDDQCHYWCAATITYSLYIILN